MMTVRLNVHRDHTSATFCTQASSVSIVMWTELVPFSLFFFFFECCFTSTEATRDIRDVHLDFHTAPEHWCFLGGLPASTFKWHSCLTHHPKQYCSIFRHEMSPRLSEIQLLQCVETRTSYCCELFWFVCFYFFKGIVGCATLFHATATSCLILQNNE